MLETVDSPHLAVYEVFKGFATMYTNNLHEM